MLGPATYPSGSPSSRHALQRRATSSVGRSDHCVRGVPSSYRKRWLAWHRAGRECNVGRTAQAVGEAPDGRWPDPSESYRSAGYHSRDRKPSAAWRDAREFGPSMRGRQSSRRRRRSLLGEVGRRPEWHGPPGDSRRRPDTRPEGAGRARLRLWESQGGSQVWQVALATRLHVRTGCARSGLARPRRRRGRPARPGSWTRRSSGTAAGSGERFQIVWRRHQGVPPSGSVTGRASIPARPGR